MQKLKKRFRCTPVYQPYPIQTGVCITLLLSLLACAERASPPNSDAFSSGQPLAEVKDDRLKEASGLAASAINPGLLWTHNDSGNNPEIYLVDEKLNILLTCELQGVTNRDWEDIAVGPGPDSSRYYIYLGDIGDNRSRYPFKYIYRFEEPRVNEDNNKLLITSIDRITFRLAGKQKDTETLLIDPSSKNLYIVSKREYPVHVYELKYPQQPDDTLVAEIIAALPLTRITGGDFSPDGKALLLKNYQNVYYWTFDAGTSPAEVFSTKPYVLPYEEEPQGEGITFARDGSGFYTISETIRGEKSFLNYHKRQ